MVGRGWEARCLGAGQAQGMTLGSTEYLPGASGEQPQPQGWKARLAWDGRQSSRPVHEVPDHPPSGRRKDSQAFSGLSEEREGR